MSEGIKVAYNACYGGFALSKKAAHRLLELGAKEMMEEIDIVEDPNNTFLTSDNYTCRVERHDPRLIQVIEELGSEASGSYAELKIKTLSGNRYIIDDYDGNERITEPQDIDWIIVLRSPYRD
jgi:hypothetical protein